MWEGQASRFQAELEALAPMPMRLWVVLTFSARGLHLSGLMPNFLDPCSIYTDLGVSQKNFHPGYSESLNLTDHSQRITLWLSLDPSNRNNTAELGFSISLLLPFWANNSLVSVGRGCLVHCTVFSSISGLCVF